MKLPCEPLHNVIAADPAAAPYVRLLYPRRIVPPQDYADPKYFSLGAVSNMRAAMMSQEQEQHRRARILFSELAHYSVPTYFIEREWLAALDGTGLPDLPLSEIKMPMPAMMFVLPMSWMIARTGWPVPYAAIGKFSGSRDADHIFRTPAFNISSPFFISKYCISLEDGEMLGYLTWRPESQQAQSIKPLSVVDDDADIVAAYYNSLEPGMGDIFLNHKCRAPTAEDDIALGSIMEPLIFKVMFALTARPHYIEQGGITRPERRKHGVVKREALWSPNVIGKGYKIRREGESLGGTHASPRMHWRRGHWHHVAHGKGRSQRRLDWFEPVLVCAEKD